MEVFHNLDLVLAITTLPSPYPLPTAIHTYLNLVILSFLQFAECAELLLTICICIYCFLCRLFCTLYNLVLELLPLGAKIFLTTPPPAWVI